MKSCYVYLWFIQYEGKEYQYHEPVQIPIAPPYEEALSLLENGSTDFRNTDFSVVIDNLKSMSLADFKEQANEKRKEGKKWRITEMDCKKKRFDNKVDNKSVFILYLHQIPINNVQNTYTYILTITK